MTKRRYEARCHCQAGFIRQEQSVFYHSKGVSLSRIAQIEEVGYFVTSRYKARRLSVLNAYKSDFG